VVLWRVMKKIAVAAIKGGGITHVTGLPTPATKGFLRLLGEFHYLSYEKGSGTIKKGVASL